MPNPLPESVGTIARVESFRSPRQNSESVASAMTMSGPVNLPNLISGNANVVKTVIDSLTSGGLPLWLDAPVDTSSLGRIFYEGNIVVHRGKIWQCIADVDLVPDEQGEPEVGSDTATYWVQLDWGKPPGADKGKVASKVVIQNVGTSPIQVVEGGGYPIADAYHFCIPAATAADDGTGGFAQWDDYRNGCIRITSLSGSWKAAVKIVWRNIPIN